MPKTRPQPQLSSPHIVLRDKVLAEDNGRLSIASSPVLYGLAVYTVMSVSYHPQNGSYSIFRFYDHLKRLAQSAQIVGMAVDATTLDAQKFTSQLKELLQANKVQTDVLVRCTLFTDDIIAGTKTHGLSTSLSMYAYTSPHFYDPKGVHVCVSSWRRTPDSCIPSRAKINGSYINATLMKNQALLDGYDDAIALDIDGHVAESTVANVFIVRGNKLITPDPSADILEGITRSTAMEWARRHDIEVVERQIDRTELYIADEVFITGTSAKITPVLSIDHRPVALGKAGNITKQLQRDYNWLLTGQLTIQPEWLTVV